MPDAAAEDLPRFIAPMLASRGPAPTGRAGPSRSSADGMRAQLRYDGGRVCVRSRPGRDCTAEFPELAAIAKALDGRRVILDGELVCLDSEGKPDFAALRNRLGRQPCRSSGPMAAVTLVIFDALHVDGRAVRELPYAARRELLASLELDGPAWRAPRHFVGQAEALLAATAELGLEGVVAKRLDAGYREGRSRAWVKHKHRRRERLAVTGSITIRWTAENGSAMSKARTEAFSDGVIAVAITLLALDLKVPDPHGAGSLAHRLAQQWPNYAAYVVSFITIGIIWINHHAMLRRIAAVDHSILMLNLVLLLTIGVLPFSTALMAQYLTAEHGQKLAAAVWGGSFLLMSLAFFAMQRHLLLARSHLVHEHMTPELRRWVLRRNAVGLVPYAIATAGAALTPYITLGMCALVAAFYALPATTSDVQAEPIEPPGTDSNDA